MITMNCTVQSVGLLEGEDVVENDMNSQRLSTLALKEKPTRTILSSPSKSEFKLKFRLHVQLFLIFSKHHK